MTKHHEYNETRLKNSSDTRVRPFFQNLLNRDASGLSWLPKIIILAPQNKDLASKLSMMNCRILDQLVEGSKNDRPKCFEHSVSPSIAFLHWLIEHPERLRVPKNYGTKDEKNRENRKCLKGEYGVQRQQGIMKDAINLLNEKGAQGSGKQWWAFEGFTRVDCLLETDDFILGIEGKRNDTVSSIIAWFPQRNQIIRNLEAIKEKAGSKSYVVILMNKDGKDPIKDNDFTNSLPHYSEQEIAEIKTHYLGAVSWQQACDAVGLDYNALPETTRDVCQSSER